MVLPIRLEKLFYLVTFYRSNDYLGELLLFMLRTWFQELLAFIANENELDKNLACLEYCNIIMTFFYYVTYNFLKSLSIICVRKDFFQNLVIL